MIAKIYPNRSISPFNARNGINFVCLYRLTAKKANRYTVLARGIEDIFFNSFLIKKVSLACKGERYNGIITRCKQRT